MKCLFSSVAPSITLLRRKMGFLCTDLNKQDQNRLLTRVFQSSDSIWM